MSAELFSGLARRANTAVSDNPPSYPIDITARGSDWLWAVFSIMAASALVLTVMTHTVPVGRRAFNYIGIALLYTAAVAYFAMASNLGKAEILAEFPRSGKAHLYSGPADNAYRSIWYARYIDWTVTTPLLLMELLLATGMPLSSIFFTIFMDLVMIETGLIGALVTSRYKWGFFAFGCAAMLYVLWSLLGPGRSYAKALGKDVHSSFIKSALILSVLWFLYPVAWGLADGGNYISPDSEMIFYGVLDVLAKPVFLFLHLFSMKNIEYERFLLQSGHASVGAQNYERNVNEKYANGGSNGPANGNDIALAVTNAGVTHGHPMNTGARPADHVTQSA